MLAAHTIGHNFVFNTIRYVRGRGGETLYCGTKINHRAHQQLRYYVIIYFRVRILAYYYT